jgi:hypothetical protein
VSNGGHSWRLVRTKVEASKRTFVADSDPYSRASETPLAAVVLAMVDSGPARESRPTSPAIAVQMMRGWAVNRWPRSASASPTAPRGDPRRPWRPPCRDGPHRRGGPGRRARHPVQRPRSWPTRRSSTEKAVSKHISSIFDKLGLPPPRTTTAACSPSHLPQPLTDELASRPWSRRRMQRRPIAAARQRARHPRRPPNPATRAT